MSSLREARYEERIMWRNVSVARILFSRRNKDNALSSRG